MDEKVKERLEKKLDIILEQFNETRDINDLEYGRYQFQGMAYILYIVYRFKSEEHKMASDIADSLYTLRVNS